MAASDNLENNGPRNGGGLVVPLHRYFERILEEKEVAYEQRFRAAQEAVQQAKDHIERIFSEHRIAHEAKHIADQEAIKQARQVIDSRLEKLNELRAEVEKDRGQFLRLETYESKHEALEKELRQVADAVKLVPSHSEIQVIAARASATERVIGPLVDMNTGSRLVALEGFKNRALGVGAVLMLLSSGLTALLIKTL